MSAFGHNQPLSNLLDSDENALAVASCNTPTARVVDTAQTHLTPRKNIHWADRPGFDFLGYRYSRQPLELAAITVERFKARYHRLYEQQQAAPDQGAALLGDYVTRWRPPVWASYNAA